VYNSTAVRWHAGGIGLLQCHLANVAILTTTTVHLQDVSSSRSASNRRHVGITVCRTARFRISGDVTIANTGVMPQWQGTAVRFSALLQYLMCGGVQTRHVTRLCRREHCRRFQSGFTITNRDILTNICTNSRLSVSLRIEPTRVLSFCECNVGNNSRCINKGGPMFRICASRRDPFHYLYFRRQPPRNCAGHGQQ